MYFELIDFPVFNVADIYVVVSMFSAIILLMFVYSNSEVDDILRLSFKAKENQDSENPLENALDKEALEEDIVD